MPPQLSRRSSLRSRRTRNGHPSFTCPPFMPGCPPSQCTRASPSTNSPQPLSQSAIQSLRNPSSFTPPLTMPGSLLIRGLSGVFISAVETVANVLIAFDAANTPKCATNGGASVKSFSNAPNLRKKRSRSKQTPTRYSEATVIRYHRNSSNSPPSKRTHRCSSQSPSPNSSIANRYVPSKPHAPRRSIYVPSRIAQAQLPPQHTGNAANSSLVPHPHIQRTRRVRFASFVETLS